MAKKIATREAYGEILVKLGEENKDIVVLDADLSKSTKTADFGKAYPERFFNMGIAEQNLLATAAGLASTGKIPFASTFAMFASGRAFEIIRNSIAYPKLNVKIAATHAGLTVGEDGATHQSVEDLALMASIPNMVVLNPADAVEAKAAIRAASEYKGPVYIRLTRGGVPVVFDEATYKYQIGKGMVIEDGEDAAIIATGVMVGAALEAREMLLEDGINVAVVNIHTLKPIDTDLIVEYAKKTGALVTAEEHSIYGGLNSIVSQVLANNYPTNVKAVAIQDTFGESGKPDELLEKYGLTAENIVKAVKEVVGKK
jgi:transketolase